MYDKIILFDEAPAEDTSAAACAPQDRRRRERRRWTPAPGFPLVTAAEVVPADRRARPERRGPIVVELPVSPWTHPAFQNRR